MNQGKSFFIEFLNTGSTGKTKIFNQCTTLGRHPSCTIQLGGDDLRVSNRHAAIFLNEGSILIEDLGSTNHVYVNDIQITKTELKHNDIVRFGSNGPQFRIIQESNLSITQKPSPDSEPQSDQLTGSDTVKSVRLQQPGIQDESSLFDVSPDLKKNISSPAPVEQNHSISRKKDTATDAGSEPEPGLPDDQDLFDVSPDTEYRNLHVKPADVPAAKPDTSKNLYTPSSNISSGEMIDDSLFNVAPDSDNTAFTTPSSISNTMEISARLQQQMISTQDIDNLVNNPKRRIKILNDKNINDQQKQIITSVTNAYSSMKRKYFIVFGIIIILLSSGILWFAHGYFNYKEQLSKARNLKDQIASVDDQIEKTLKMEGDESHNLEMLYSKLQQVQAQFDSVKTTLELKDQHKIYSDTVEVFLEAIMSELNVKNYSIPQHMLERVKYYINIFTTSNRRSTEILMQRRKNYFNEIEQVFLQKNVPAILAYVAMQESMLDTIIKSPAGAVGMWQFMEHTGRRFNLTINSSTDERTNWRKSTVAAADYFRTLLLLFGDGRGALLAMAAYNAGEEKIKKALKNVENPILDRDFWYLYRTSSILAVETREYVPQVLARIIIDRHPGLYGF
ncbi:MAG: transglycosylase SLT domain-containing protein [Chitinispirillaceae bacterium]|nr:transglycosylase SLT domain-containing protein [Chitinispirillaceae bacterium]